MITSLLRLALAAAMAAGTFLAASPVQAAAAEVELPLSEAVDTLPVAAEDRTGYSRDLFKHWVDADRDGCSTRAEVLLEEAVVAPEVTGRCSITRDTGEWYSLYDGVTVTNAGSLDIDHMVPLAEAWDSGASQWDAQRREEYANDLGDPRALIAVTAKSNRSKSDQDPAEWMVSDEEAVCEYVASWTAVKHRWGLTVDEAEAAALAEAAAGCEDVTVRVTLAS